MEDRRWYFSVCAFLAFGSRGKDVSSAHRLSALQGWLPRVTCLLSRCCIPFPLCISQGYCCWPFCRVSLSYSPFTSLSDELRALLSNWSNLYGVWIPFTEEARHALDGSVVPGWMSRGGEYYTCFVALVPNLWLELIWNYGPQCSQFAPWCSKPTEREGGGREGREEEMSSAQGLQPWPLALEEGSSSLGMSSWQVLTLSWPCPSRPRSILYFICAACFAPHCKISYTQTFRRQ